MGDLLVPAVETLVWQRVLRQPGPETTWGVKRNKAGNAQGWKLAFGKSSRH